VTVSGAADRATAPAGVPLLALGFRPFFLGAGVAGVVLVGVWLGVLAGGFPLHTWYDAVGGSVFWHAHEMLFGYVTAVVAGFLLTAVRNWTGVDTPTGTPLFLLALLWMAGRVVPFLVDVLPGAWIAAVDLAFLPALLVALAGPLWKQRAPRNLAFIAILLALFLANLLVHLQALSVTLASARLGLNLAVDLFALVIAIIGGRVVPLFTRGALSGATPRQWPLVDAVAVWTLVAIAALRLLGPESPSLALLRGLAALSALAHAVRLWGWFDRRVLRTPLLWILYVGYGWLVIGLVLSALPGFPGVVGLHAFTAGAMGSMTLGMMTRVSLGHTGRTLQPGRPLVLAFALIAAAGVARVALPLLRPDLYADSLILAGALWVTAFGLFAAGIAPFLLTPRADGRPG
jgi:uncharacterized protein involved in response to NO